MKPFIPLLVIAVVFILIALTPAILALVLDPINIKRIRSQCAALGLTDVRVDPFPNHYGVRFRKGGQEFYAKCAMKGFKLKWKGKSLEDF